MLPPSSISSTPLQLALHSRTLLSACRAFTNASFHASAVPWFLLHSRSAHEKAHFFNSSNLVQKNRDILAKTSNGCSLTKRKMVILASALSGFLLSGLLLGSFNDVAAARAAVFGLEFFSTQEEAQQQQIEPSKGNCATCLGVVDETLGACGTAPNCVSTFDDRPSFFIAPWEFPGKLTTAFKQINLILLEEGANIVEEGNRYIHAVFTDKDGTIDDLEFLFSIPSEDATVNIRSASRKLSQNDYGRNQKRLEKIRQALTWEEVPVLRNRSRKLFFLESPWDTFGPELPPGFEYKDKLEFVPD